MRGASGGPDVEAGAAVSADGDIAGGGGGWRWIRQAPPLLFFFLSFGSEKVKQGGIGLLICLWSVVGLWPIVGVLFKGLPSIF
jgi:hypothetical protein